MAIEIIDPNKLDIKVTLNGTEWLIILNPDTKKLERCLLSTAMNESTPFIEIDNNVFRLIKNPANDNTLNKKTVELNDFVVNGFYTGDNGSVLINSAKYSGTGNINDFGTDAGNYQDGSYISVKFSRLN